MKANSRSSSLISKTHTPIQLKLYLCDTTAPREWKPIHDAENQVEVNNIWSVPFQQLLNAALTVHFNERREKDDLETSQLQDITVQKHCLKVQIEGIKMT